MSQNTAADALRALTAEQGKKSKTEQFRDLFDDIEKAQLAGISRELIVKTLNKHGFDITLKTFDTMLYRIRKERGITTRKHRVSSTADKTTVIPPAKNADIGKQQRKRAIHHEETNGDGDFVNPLDKIMENYNKEREQNPRRDDFTYNPVPDLEKLYGKKK